MVFASFCSLLIWIVFLLPSNFDHLFNVVLRKPDIFNGNLGMFISSFAGLIARFAAVIIAMAVGFTIWGTNTKPTKKLERLIETALFLEGTYFVLLFPQDYGG
jgi:hypothetical protein